MISPMGICFVCDWYHKSANIIYIIHVQCFIQINHFEDRVHVQSDYSLLFHLKYSTVVGAGFSQTAWVHVMLRRN